MHRHSNNRTTIGRLASLCGLHPDTIRHYDRCGLLAPERRSATGYRLYGADCVRRLNFIQCARDLGFTLDEIGQLLAIRPNTGATCADMLALTRTKIVEATPLAEADCGIS